MTKDEALKLALEALRFGLHVGFDESSESQIKKGGKAFDQHNKAITAIKQALAAPVHEPVAWMDALKDAFFEGFTSAETYNDILLNSPEEAWAKYKPPVTLPAASVRQEPVGRVVSANCEYATVQWLRQTSEVGGGDPKNARSWPIAGDAVYTTPPAQPSPVQEPVAWQPIETAPKGSVAILVWCPKRMNIYAAYPYKSDWCAFGGGVLSETPTHWMPMPAAPGSTPPNVATPPAAQRQWVGLTDEDWQDISDKTATIIWSSLKQAVDDKLKEKNT